MTINLMSKYIDIIKKQINTYMKYLQDIGKKTSTISRNLASIRSFYQYLIRIKKIKHLWDQILL